MLTNGMNREQRLIADLTERRRWLSASAATALFRQMCTVYGTDNAKHYWKESSR